MKCTEIERRIYLYEELDARERRETDQHLETCQGCRQVLAAAHASKNVIANLKAEHPVSDVNPWLTNRIMESIGEIERTKTPVWERVLQALMTPSLRNGMAGLSFGLILLFLGEYGSGGPLELTKRYPARSVKNTELNLASFHAAFLNAKKTRQSVVMPISKCLLSCREDQSQICRECTEKYIKY